MQEDLHVNEHCLGHFAQLQSQRNITIHWHYENKTEVNAERSRLRPITGRVNLPDVSNSWRSYEEF